MAKKQTNHELDQLADMMLGFAIGIQHDLGKTQAEVAALCAHISQQIALKMKDPEQMAAARTLLTPTRPKKKPAGKRQRN